MCVGERESEKEKDSFFFLFLKGGGGGGGRRERGKKKDEDKDHKERAGGNRRRKRKNYVNQMVRQAATLCRLEFLSVLSHGCIVFNTNNKKILLPPVKLPSKNRASSTALQKEREKKNRKRKKKKGYYKEASSTRCRLELFPMVSHGFIITTDLSSKENKNIHTQNPSATFCQPQFVPIKSPNTCLQHLKSTPSRGMAFAEVTAMI